MKIAKSHPKLKVEREFTQKEMRYLQILEEDISLEPFLIRLRQAVSLPDEGVDLNNPAADSTFYKLLKSDDEAIIKLSRVAKLFLLAYHLPPRWMATAISLVLFNVATPPDGSLYKSVEVEYAGPPEVARGKFPEVRIIIREYMPVSRLKKIIGENKEWIKRLMTTLPKEPKIGIGKLQTRKKILSLKRKGLTYSKIADRLGGKIGMYDFETVRDLKRRLEQYMKKTIPNLPRLLLAINNKTSQ